MGIITAHGYYPMGWSTKGFEWVSPIVELSHRQIPITIHSIAAPLAVMERQQPGCENISKEEYKISNTVSDTQWKTVKNQDGAFKTLKFDPQEVFIDGGTSILLPGEWNNSRLGHNRSIQWVCENI